MTRDIASCDGSTSNLGSGTHEIRGTHNPTGGWYSIRLVSSTSMWLDMRSESSGSAGRETQRVSLGETGVDTGGEIFSTNLFSLYARKFCLNTAGVVDLAGPVGASDDWYT